MKVLLTNDDGYESEGLLRLKNILERHFDVIVVAPYKPQSGKGASLTIREDLEIYPIERNYYALNGTPVDCVLFGLSKFKDIDLVISGCNNGYNLGIDTIYSGTCGACVQALIGGAPAIAFSCYSSMFFDQIDREVEDVLEYIINGNLLSDQYFLNVNFQHPNFTSYRGIKLTELFVEKIRYYSTSDNPDYFTSTRELNNVDSISYDRGAIKAGFISITPLKNNLFDKEILRKITKRI